MLRLGIHGLSTVDAAIIKLILRGDSTFNLVDEAPYDGLVTDDVQCKAWGLSPPHAAMTLKIVSTGQEEGAGQLVRPIRQENVRLWLGRVKAFKERQQGVRMALASRRYKLTRWPPTELLAGQHQKYRICSTLCRASLSLSELSEATQEPVINCKAMLEELAIFQVLHIDDHLANRHARLSTAPSSLATKKMSWIKQVRRRLGI